MPSGKRNTAGGELWKMSAAEMHELVVRREASVKDIVLAHLNRIRAINPDINAVTSVLEEQVLQEAGRKDEYLTTHSADNPLFGVPFSVKENVDLAGSATTEGVRFLKDNVVGADSPHVGHMKRSGAVPLARTNMPDFGLRYHTENDLHGATINPWNALLTPGGSSGGDAAAVATGMVPIGLGNDYGGSIRYPAQCCGVCGLRPTLGRIPFHTQSLSEGMVPQSLKICAVQGPLARRVEDLRLALNVMSVYDPRDPNWVPAPWEGKQTQPFRIAIITNPAGLGVDDSVREGVVQAGKILENHGAIVEEFDSSTLVESAELWLQIVTADLRHLFLSGINTHASAPARRFVEQILSLQTDTSLSGYINSLARANSIAKAWEEFFQQFDAILGPVSSRNPFPVGQDVLGVDAVRSLLDSQVLTVSVNLLGLPSVSLPVCVTKGIPQAVQIIGPRFHEYRCLDIAQLIENDVGIFTPIDPRKEESGSPAFNHGGGVE